MRNYLTILISILSLGITGCSAQKDDGVKHITVEEFKNLDFDYQLVDVRTPEEYMSGALQDAKNINFFSAEFLAGINKLDKETPVVLYCRSGRRSAKAGANLVQAGFKEVYNVKGGILEYNKTVN